MQDENVRIYWPQEGGQNNTQFKGIIRKLPSKRKLLSTTLKGHSTFRSFASVAFKNVVLVEVWLTNKVWLRFVHGMVQVVPGFGSDSSSQIGVSCSFLCLSSREVWSRCWCLGQSQKQGIQGGWGFFLQSSVQTRSVVEAGHRQVDLQAVLTKTFWGGGGGAECEENINASSGSSFVRRFPMEPFLETLNDLLVPISAY